MFFVRLTPAIGFDAAALFAAGCPLPQGLSCRGERKASVPSG